MEENEIPDPLSTAEAREAESARIAPHDEGAADKVARLELDDAIGRADLGVPPVQMAEVADVGALPDGSGSDELDAALDIHDIHELEDPDPVEPIDTEDEDPSIMDFLDVDGDGERDSDDLYSPPH